MAGGDGGGVGPRVLQVLDFAAARAPELQALRELAHDPRVVSAADEKLLTQKNQRRRRANAFNSYSMPQRLKQRGRRGRGGRQHKTEEEEKRCRTHERRPHALLAQRTWETAPETGKSALLPTHVWHAKRMKMQDRHGVVAAEKRADKSVSAALEALRKTAVVHDASYYGVLELFGLPQVLLEALQLVSDPSGSDFHGVRFLSGGEEGRSVLYHTGQFPNGAICPVAFMWRPVGDDWSTTSDDGAANFELKEAWSASKRQLWLWIHPAAFMEAATAIATACREVVDEGEEIEIRDRRGHLCRFKVRGKRADELVARLCQVESTVATNAMDTRVSDQQQEDDGAESDYEDGFEASSTIATCTGANREALLKETRRSKSGLGSPLDVAAVYSVAVADPRSYSSERQQKQMNSKTGMYSLLQEPPQSAVGQVGVDEIVSPLTGESLSSLGKRAEEPDSAFILRELSRVLSWTTKGPAESMTGYPFEAPSLAGGTDVTAKLDVSMSGSCAEDDNCDDTHVAAKPCSWLWSVSKRDFLRRSFRKDHELNAEIFRQRKIVSGLLSTSALSSRSEAATQPESLLHLLAIRQPETFRDASGWDLVCSPSMALVLLKALVFRGGMVVGTEEDAAIATVLHCTSFPRDFPDTRAGQEWWQEGAERLQEEQDRKPKAKRFAYGKLGVDSAEEEESVDEAAAYEKFCVLRGATYMEPFCFYPKAQSEATPPFIPVAVPTLVSVIIAVVGRGSLVPNTMLYAPSKADRAELERDSKWRGSPVSRMEQRALVGYVTSAVYDRPKAAFRAVGFCSCESLQRLFLEQAGPSGSSGVFALARPPQGKMLRLVRLSVHI